MAIKSSLQNIKPLTSRLRYGEGSVTPVGLDMAQELARVRGSDRYADSRTMYKGSKGVQFGSRLEALQNALVATMGEQEGRDVLKQAMNPATRGDKTMLASLIQRIYNFKDGVEDIMKPAAPAAGEPAAPAAGEPAARRMITRNVNGTVVSGFELEGPPDQRVAPAARAAQTAEQPRIMDADWNRGVTVGDGKYTYWTPAKSKGLSMENPDSQMFGLSPGLDRELNAGVNRAVSEAYARQVASAAAKPQERAVSPDWVEQKALERVAGDTKHIAAMRKAVIGDAQAAEARRAGQAQVYRQNSLDAEARGEARRDALEAAKQAEAEDALRRKQEANARLQSQMDLFYSIHDKKTGRKVPRMKLW